MNKLIYYYLKVYFKLMMSNHKDFEYLSAQLKKNLNP